MVQSCVVVGCTNRWDKKSKVSWHRIPSENNADRRRKWLTSINRKDWMPKNADRVCGIHFISGCASQDPNDPDFVPSVNMGYQKALTSTPKVKKERFERVRSRENRKYEEELELKERHDAASVLMDLSSSLNIDDSFVNCEADTDCTPSKDKIKDNVDKCVEEIANLKMQNKSLIQELGRLQAENGQLKEENKQQRFGLEFLKSSDKTVNFYTGIPNFATLKWLIDYVQPSLAVFHSVQDEDVVLIVLMKIRLNLLNIDLSTGFNVATSTISDVLNKSIPLIADKLKFLIHWPEKDDTIRTLPKVFKAKYKNARCIIDCTEVFIERPGNLTARAATWSNYKHHNTLKYLVAITPCGSISFVSKAFGGRTS